MKRKSSPSNPIVDEAEYASLKGQSRGSATVRRLMFIPFSAIFSSLGVLLYIVVGGVDVKADFPYIAAAYAIGSIGLAIAYSNVSSWVAKQRAQQLKSSDFSGTEHVWFTLFYNNAFYVFLILLCSHLLFANLQPTTSMTLAQLASVAVPAWMSSLSK